MQKIVAAQLLLIGEAQLKCQCQRAVTLMLQCKGSAFSIQGLQLWG